MSSYLIITKSYTDISVLSIYLCVLNTLNICNSTPIALTKSLLMKTTMHVFLAVPDRDLLV